MTRSTRTLRTLKTIRNIPRLKDITLVLMKHGLSSVASAIGAPLPVRLRRLWMPADASRMSQAERLRHAFQELGPIFIKLGQIIASRPDLFPLEWVEEFAKLEDRVEPIPFDKIREVIESELGRPPEQVFKSLEVEPIGSASIAQIHRATLEGGEQVILKVQKPGILPIIERDMEIFALVAEALSGFPELESVDPEGLVAEVHRNLEREINFNFERNALDRVRANFDGDPTMVVPKTYPQHSTSRLLVMDFLQGVSLRKFEGAPQEARHIVKECTRILFQMIFRDGYFHADPHASNLMSLAGGKVGWIDFGSMGLFTEEMRLRLVRLLRALLSRDYHHVARLVLRLGRPRGDVSLFELSQDLATRLDPFFGLTLREIDLSELFNAVMNLARDHRISIAPGFIVMTRCLVLIEGVCHRLDPEYNTMDEMEPLARQYLKERLRPDRLAGEVEGKLREMVNTLWEYPQHTGEILRKMAQGRFQVDTHVQGLDKLGRRVEGSANAVVQALIVSSLLVSASLIVNADIDPQIYGTPALAWLGYVGAALIGARVFFMSLWRR